MSKSNQILHKPQVLIKLSDFLATGFYSGRLPRCPGTFGTVAALLCVLALHWLIPGSLTTNFFIILSIVTLLIGIYTSNIVCTAEIYGSSKDPGQIVIDEFAGYFVCLIAAPMHTNVFLLAFVLFRVFDILKPPPIKFLERAPHGVGIMIDDIAAGIYGAISLQAILHFVPPHYLGL